MADSRTDFRNAKKHILLDTNVWNYLADHANANVLAKAARLGNAKIVVAPAVVLEAMAVRDSSLLRLRAQLLTDERWKRLMPEAYSECAEVLQETKRLRPDWILRRKPVAAAQRLFRGWRRNAGGFWARIQRTPELASETIREMQHAVLSRAREESKAAREYQVRNNYPVWTAPLGSYLTRVGKMRPNDCDTVEVAAWRRASFNSWSVYVGTVSEQPNPTDMLHGYIDWLSAELDFLKVQSDPDAWYKFWIFETEENRMPREWLRWAGGLLQQFSGWTRGTPGDNALTTYLVEADVFITADAGLYRIVQKLHLDAPIRIARPLLVDGGRSGANGTIASISRGCPP